MPTSAQKKEQNYPSFAAFPQRNTQGKCPSFTPPFWTTDDHNLWKWDPWNSGTVGPRRRRRRTRPSRCCCCCCMYNLLEGTSYACCFTAFTAFAAFAAFAGAAVPSELKELKNKELPTAATSHVGRSKEEEEKEGQVRLFEADGGCGCRLFQLFGTASNYFFKSGILVLFVLLLERNILFFCGVFPPTHQPFRQQGSPAAGQPGRTSRVIASACSRLHKSAAFRQKQTWNMLWKV